MKKMATILAFVGPLAGIVAPASADEQLAQRSPPVQVAPPVERPYGSPSSPPSPVPYDAYRGQYQPYRGAPSTCLYETYTELRIAPAYGGIAWVYDGATLV